MSSASDTTGRTGPMNPLHWLCFFLIPFAAHMALASSESAIYLKKHDKDGIGASDPSSYMSSFLSNPTEAGYGWSDGNDPDPTKDYRLNGKLLFTPYGNSSEIYTFPGRSLTIDGGGVLANRSVVNGVASTVYIGNLIVRQGSISNQQWSRENIWDGVFTFEDNGITNRFIINLDRCIIKATLKSSPGVNVGLSGTTGNKMDSKNRYYWSHYLLQYKYHFNGDCSDYYATNHLKWSAAAYLGTEEFAGSFNLGNIGHLTIATDDDRISSVRIGGSVFGRDGWLQVPSGKSMDVKGGIDFAFADRSTHVFEGIDVYTNESSDNEYVNANSITFNPDAYVNAVRIEDNASLSATSAALSGTLISVGTGSTFTVGDLTLDGSILECAGEVIVTNSLSVKSPVTIIPVDFTGGRVAVLRIPLAKEGAIDLVNFRLQKDGDVFRHLEWKEENGTNVLYYTDKACGTYDQTTGYVTLTTSETLDNIKTDGYSFSSAKFWSDGLAPHSTTNYYVGKTLFPLGGEFKGASLTLKASLRMSTSVKCTIDDLRILPGAGFIAPGGNKVSPFSGRMFVYSTQNSPFQLSGGTAGQWYVIDMSVFGSTKSVITIDGQYAPGAVSVGADFVGDCTQYHGLITVGVNETLRLGNTGLPNGIVELRTAYSVLSSVATNGADVHVGTLRTILASTIDVPATNTISLGLLDVTDVLTKKGNGTLRIGGQQNAGEGARLNVVAGRICAMSCDAFEGMPVTLGSGARLVVDTEATGDLKELGIVNTDFGSAFASESENGHIPLCFTGNSDEDVVYIAVCTISENATVPTFSLPGKHGRHKVSSAVWRTNADGTRTFLVKLVRAGMIFSIR